MALGEGGGGGGGGGCYTFLHKVVCFDMVQVRRSLLWFPLPPPPTHYRLSLQGMGDILVRCPDMMANCCVNLEEIGVMRRYSVDDQLVTSLLHGVRLCV